MHWFGRKKHGCFMLFMVSPSLSLSLYGWWTPNIRHFKGPISTLVSTFNLWGKKMTLETWYWFYHGFYYIWNKREEQNSARKGPTLDTSKKLGSSILGLSAKWVSKTGSWGSHLFLFLQTLYNMVSQMTHEHSRSETRNYPPSDIRINTVLRAEHWIYRFWSMAMDNSFLNVTCA